MKRSDLVIGGKYLVGLPPFPLTTVVYLGPAIGWPGKCRVRGLIDKKVSWVRLEDLLPLLRQVVSR
jgi:hypothetical protein